MDGDGSCLDRAGAGAGEAMTLGIDRELRQILHCGTLPHWKRMIQGFQYRCLGHLEGPWELAFHFSGSPWTSCGDPFVCVACLWKKGVLRLQSNVSNLFEPCLFEPSLGQIMHPTGIPYKRLFSPVFRAAVQCLRCLLPFPVQDLGVSPPTSPLCYKNLSYLLGRVNKFRQ